MQGARDYGPLEDAHQRITEEQRQREDADRQQREAAQQQAAQQGYSVLQETHERIARDQQAADQVARQGQEMTELAYGPRADEPAQPMQLDAPEITPEQLTADQVQGGGDLQFTPAGTIRAFHHHEAARERPGIDAGDADQEQARGEITDRKAESTDRQQETTDRQAEVTDARAEKSDRDIARERFVARFLREGQERQQERGRDD